MIIPFSVTVVGQKCIRPSIIEAARNGKYCITIPIGRFHSILFQTLSFYNWVGLIRQGGLLENLWY